MWRWNSFFVFIIFVCFWFLNALVFGPVDEEAYFKEKGRVVGIRLIEGNYQPVFNEEAYNPNSAVIKGNKFFRRISRSLPPVYEIELKGTRLVLFTWPHGGFPVNIQNLFLKICSSVLFARLPILLLSLGILIGTFFLSIKIINTQAAFFSVASLSSLSSFFILSLIGSSIIYEFAIFCEILFLIFLTLYADTLKMRHLFIASCFAGMLLMSYLPFSLIILSSFLAIFVLRKEFNIGIRQLILLIVVVGIFVIPVVFSSLDSPKSPILGSPRIPIFPRDEQELAIFKDDWTRGIFRNPLLFIGAVSSNPIPKNFEEIKYRLKNLVYDLSANFDIREGFGKHLDVNTEPKVKISPLLSIPFTLAVLLCLIRCDPRALLVPIVVLIFLFFHSFFWAHEGFSRRILPAIPLMCMCFGRFLWRIWIQGCFFKALATLFLIAVCLSQVSITWKILKDTKNGEPFYIYHPMNAQKELAYFLLKEKIYEPINISSLTELGLLTGWKVKPIDCSYLVTLKNFVNFDILKFLRMIEGREVIVGWIEPWDFRSLEKQSLSLGFKIRKIASFPSGKPEPIFTLAKVERM